MRNNLFFSVLIGAIILSGFTSCNDDNDTAVNTPPPSFFNLNTGNEWVYKKYENSNDNPDHFTFTGITDSVKVLGVANINGVLFSKLSHKKTGQEVYHEYMRVNSTGHLVSFTDLIYFSSFGGISETNPSQALHPGLDSNYQVTTTSEYGSLHYHLNNLSNISVEGNNYLVSPYVGDFILTIPDTGFKTVEYNYQPTIGLVKQVCHSVGGNYTWEERLVSYSVN